MSFGRRGVRRGNDLPAGGMMLAAGPRRSRDGRATRGVRGRARQGGVVPEEVKGREKNAELYAALGHVIVQVARLCSPRRSATITKDAGGGGKERDEMRD